MAAAPAGSADDLGSVREAKVDLFASEYTTHVPYGPPWQGPVLRWGWTLSPTPGRGVSFMHSLQSP